MFMICGVDQQYPSSEIHLPRGHVPSPATVFASFNHAQKRSVPKSS